jgi:hypothetical protein
MHGMQIWASLAETSVPTELGPHTQALQQELTQCMPDFKAVLEEDEAAAFAEGKRLNVAVIAACMGCDPPDNVTPGAQRLLHAWAVIINCLGASHTPCRLRNCLPSFAMELESLL